MPLIQNPVDDRKPGFEAGAAYEAYAALARFEAMEPVISENPYWRALRETAYARFLMLYEAGQ